MFSSYLPPVSNARREQVCAGTGLLLIVGLLVAIATVAGGAVRQAQARDSLQASQQSALMYCLETLRGAALNSCMQQARADQFNDGSSAQLARAAQSGGAAMAPGSALLPVAFSAAR